MNQRFLRPGSKVELTSHASAIPAGTYTFVKRHDELLVFYVSPQIGFVLASSYWEHLVRPALDTRRSTCESTFLEEYATLLQRQVSQPLAVPQAAVATCFMSQRALKRVERHFATESGPRAPREVFPSLHERVSMAA
jgi:hypothetical protein